MGSFIAALQAEDSEIELSVGGAEDMLVVAKSLKLACMAKDEGRDSTYGRIYKRLLLSAPQRHLRAYKKMFGVNTVGEIAYAIDQMEAP